MKSDFREIKNSKKENRDKIIVLDGFSDKQLHDFIYFYKKNKMPRAIFATTTKYNKEFKLKDLLSELKREKKLLKK